MEDAEAKTLASRYLAFLWLAFNSANGRFRNFLSYERQWQESQGSEDSHGRALWALGTAVNQTVDESLRGLAGRLFELAVPAALTFTSPRAWAFSLFGIQEYLDRFPGRPGRTEAERCTRWTVAEYLSDHPHAGLELV